MTHKTRRTKIFTLALGLAMCLAVSLGIVFASPTSTAYAADETQIDTLGVAFKKVGVGDALDAAFDFENATNKTLKVPAGANYTATLVSVSKNGQGIKLWDNNDTSLPWSRVETQSVEQNVAYCIRVRFKTNDGYKLVRDAARLRSNMQVLGAELGKGKDIEIWDSAGMNSMATIVNMDFLITKGMAYIGNIQSIYPEIGKSKTGTIGIEGVDTGFFISGAPAPYTYEAKIAPIGMEIKTSNVFDKSNCYYQITAMNAMDGGTMYITATAADGKTCNIPVQIAAVSGGHEHTWSDFGKIDFEYHGYRKCTDPACPGIAYGFDTGSQYAVHEFVGGCTEKCTKCGNLDNPNAKHNLAELVEETPATCVANGMKAHYKCAGCGKYFDENKNETTEEALKTPISPYYGHSFGFWVEEQYATCQAPGRKGYKHCSICNKDYDASNKEITDWVIPVNPDGHELGDLVAEVPATCKDTGVKEHRDCRLCGKHCDPISRKEIADLTIPTTNNHTYGELIPEVPATCKDTGVKAHKDCKLCGKHCDPITKKEIADLTIPTTNNHTYGELIPEVPATTEDFGVKEHKDCKVCGRHFDKDGNEITELRIAKIGTHNVIVNGESKFYAHGESVTATAKAPPAGKAFKGWKDASGNIVSTDTEYTFTVTGETTLTAVYEDMPEVKPNKKEGLSGGAIAGIVGGLLAVAGVGGFALYWFVVRQKTFADLIAAIKGTPKNK